jgi:gamma-glutamyltranspeptidase / glutathione hydrolase
MSHQPAVALPRSPLYAPRGAVATTQPLAAEAGLAVLRRGGNAVDAAIATAVALTVVQPTSNDIGSDLFAIVWDGEKLHGLNGSGRSPAALTRETVRLAAGDQRTMPERGWLPVTVPGAPAGWRDLHARFGSLPFADLFTDAIAYAERGYPVSPRIAGGWARGVTAHRAPARSGATPTPPARCTRLPSPARRRSTPATSRWPWPSTPRAPAAC